MKTVKKPKPAIAVLDYGMGNLYSVSKALERVGGVVRVTNNPKEIGVANALVVPGVGAFGDAIKAVKPFQAAIAGFVRKGKPVLGICLGMQLLFEESTEGGLFEGLGFFEGRIIRFPKKVKTPHVGWNNLRINRGCPLFASVQQGAFAYFVHSYYAKPLETSAIATTTGYSVRFASSVWRDSLYGVQFHPEKSGETGSRILRNFVELARK